MKQKDMELQHAKEQIELLKLQLLSKPPSRPASVRKSTRELIHEDKESWKARNTAGLSLDESQVLIKVRWFSND
jgi:hypothetical protein